MKLGNGFGLLAAALAGFVFANSSASAAGYPDKQVKWVVGYPAGGTTDILARIIGNALSEKLGQQFIIENKPGAGNNIATEFVINSAPDATPSISSIRRTASTPRSTRSYRSISSATWPRSAA